MKVLTDEQIDTLKRFNIAVDQILASGFVKEMAGKQTHIKITMDKIDQKTGAFEQSHEREGFDPEFTTSVLTKVRLFTDDATDYISIRTIEPLYQSLPIDQKYKDRMKEVRRLVNQNLDQAGFVIGGSLTSRQIFDTLTYGMFIHLNVDKVKVLELWKKDALLWDMCLHDFEDTVAHLIIAMKVVYENNKLVIRDYGR